MLSLERVARSIWNRQRSSAPAPIMTRIGASTSSRMAVIMGLPRHDKRCAAFPHAPPIPTGGARRERGPPPLSDVLHFGKSLAFFLQILVRSPRRRRLYLALGGALGARLVTLL